MKRHIPLMVFMAVTAALPWLFPDNYYLTVVGVLAALRAVVAVGLNLLMGVAGQISLGHAAFFGLGAYASGILTTRFAWQPWMGLLGGMVLAGVLAFAVARPVLRLRGHALAMATLGLGIIFHIFLVQSEAWSGGPDGLSGIPPLTLGGLAIVSDTQWYWVALSALWLTLWMAGNLMDSRSGRALCALHGSEVAASMMGVDVAAAKTRIFVFSAVLAAVAGSLFAHQQSFISPGTFSFVRSVELVVMVVLGGLGSLYGAVFGAVVLTLLPELLVVFEEYEMMVLGGVMMGIMIFMPRGLWVGLVAGLRRLGRRAFSTAGGR
ncbi:MAG: branched-chain amino acid ABC transporter permease [Magnetococcus sp. WYHC-3]